MARALVFAVDDEQDNLDLLQRILFHVCRLRVFVSAEDALVAAKADRPELVLIDQRLRGQSGADFLRSLRKEGIHCCAIFITANPEAPDVQQLVTEQEALWILPKPYTTDDLPRQVTMALSLSKVRHRVKSKTLA
jgi:FixJ family two-component response regulator